MPEEKNVCLFDNDKQCPVRTGRTGAIIDVVRLEKACPICPIRIRKIPASKIK